MEQAWFIQITPHPMMTHLNCKEEKMETTREIINGKSRIVRTIKIDWNGEPKEVKIKKLNFGEYNEVQRASAKISSMGGIPKVDIDSVAMNENALLKSIIEAPFPVTIADIRALDKEVADVILTDVNELNSPTDKKKDI